MPNKNKSHVGRNISIGLGLGLAAALAAGTYFLSGKNANKHKKQVKSWMLKARAEVLDELGSLKDVNEKAYKNVVDSVMSAYRGVKNIDVKELTELGKELKSHWLNIQRDLERGMKSGGKRK